MCGKVLGNYRANKPSHDAGFISSQTDLFFLFIQLLSLVYLYSATLSFLSFFCFNRLLLLGVRFLSVPFRCSRCPSRTCDSGAGGGEFGTNSCSRFGLHHLSPFWQLLLSGFACDLTSWSCAKLELCQIHRKNQGSQFGLQTSHDLLGDSPR